MRAVLKSLSKCLAVWLLSCAAYGGTTNTAGVITQYDAANGNLFILKGGTQTNVLAIGSDDVGGTFQQPRFGSGYIYNKSQDFTDAGGYEVITNFAGASSYGIGTLTHTSLTVIADGTYDFRGSFSGSSDKAVQVHLHAFTNGVIVTNVGSEVDMTAAAKYFTLPFGGHTRMYSNDTITLRMDVDDDVTITFNHVDATLSLIGPIDSAP